MLGLLSYSYQPVNSPHLGFRPFRFDIEVINCQKVLAKNNYAILR